MFQETQRTLFTVVASAFVFYIVALLVLTQALPMAFAQSAKGVAQAEDFGSAATKAGSQAPASAKDTAPQPGSAQSGDSQAGGLNVRVHQPQFAPAASSLQMAAPVRQESALDF